LVALLVAVKQHCQAVHYVDTLKELFENVQS